MSFTDVSVILTDPVAQVAVCSGMADAIPTVDRSMMVCTSFQSVRRLADGRSLTASGSIQVDYTIIAPPNLALDSSTITSAAIDMESSIQSALDTEGIGTSLAGTVAVSVTEVRFYTRRSTSTSTSTSESTLSTSSASSESSVTTAPTLETTLFPTTTTTTTTTTIDSAEILNDAEEAENALADSLLQDIANSGGLAENQTMATIESVPSASGVTSAAVVDTAALVEAGQPAKVNVAAPGGGTISASISPEALASVGGNAVILVTAINASFLASFQEAGAEDQPEEEKNKLASLPVSIRLVNEDGEEVNILELTEPIEVQLVVENRTSDMVCGWFNEDTKVWETEGIELVDPESDDFICGTTHLTVFGAVIKGALGAITCANADLLTPEALKRIGDDEWWHQPSAILFWALIAAELILMFYIGYRSTIQRAVRGWSDEFLLTQSKAFDKQSEAEATSALKKSKTLDTVIPKKPLYTPSGFGNFITARVARMAVAAQEGVNAQDLGAILKGGIRIKKLEASGAKGAWQPETERRGSLDSSQSRASRGSRTETMKHIPLLKEVGTGAGKELDHFLDMGFIQRSKVLFLAGNAWISLGRFSFTVPPTFRALLLAMRVHGSLFCSAFFYSATGAPSKDADSACSPVGFWENVGRNIVISWFSIMISSVPFFLLLAAASRGFVYRESWDQASREKYLAKLHFQGRVLWSMGVFYVAFCTLFVTSFLANVGEGSTVDWLTAATTDLIMSIILDPLIKALLLAGLMSLVVSLQPQQVRREISEIENTFKMLVDEDQPVDKHLPAAEEEVVPLPDPAPLRSAAVADEPLRHAPRPVSSHLPGMPDMRPSTTDTDYTQEDELGVPNFVRAAVLPYGQPPNLPPLPPLSASGTLPRKRAPAMLATPPANFWAMRSPAGANPQGLVAPEDDSGDEAPGSLLLGPSAAAVTGSSFNPLPAVVEGLADEKDSNPSNVPVDETPRSEGSVVHVPRGSEECLE